jgi:hypothetical protein
MEPATQIDQLILELNARERLINELRRSISELNREILDRDGLVAISEIQLEQYHEAIRALTGNIDMANDELFEERKQFRELQKDIEILQREIRERQKAIEVVLQSFGWKIAAPLRWAYHLASRLKHRFDHTEASPNFGSYLSNLAFAPIPTCRSLTADDSTGVRELASDDIPRHRRGNRYVSRMSDSLDATRLEIKAIAFFEAEENEDAWSDVTAAMPRYLGHYQPRLPDDFVFDWHSTLERIQKQKELAEQYGLYGFCFKLSWPFSNPEKAFHLIPQFLNAPESKLKFCICGTIESGCMKDATQQTFEISAVLKDILLEPRYIRIDGKPLLIFHGDDIDLNSQIAVSLRSQTKALGLPELFLIGTCTEERSHFDISGFDAVLDIQPQFHRLEAATLDILPSLSEFKGRAYNYSGIVERSRFEYETASNLFDCVVPGWDEEASNPGSGTSLTGATPALYAKWLRNCIQQAVKRPPEQRMVFIRSWNDWRHGCYLEPDHRFGYAFLHTTANVLRSYYFDAEQRTIIASNNAAFVPSSKIAIVLHCYYEDLIPAVFDQFLSHTRGADLFVTVRNDVSSAALREIQTRCPNVYFFCNENRGRDIRPFLRALQPLESFGYKIVCKIHTKKTPNSKRGFGDAWRQRMMQSLLGSPDSVTKISSIFSDEPGIGILVPEGSVMDLSDVPVHVRNTYWLDYFFKRIGRSDLIGNYLLKFPAGSMFWCRISALSGLDQLALEGDRFEDELGQVDGTLAHAIERLFALFAQEKGFSMREISSTCQLQ